ncbi:MAG: hypothetical protein IT355_00155 [Gemmatimonadaceae bacterium]|nr:hypothetical protein [Gemmatimonadaceae bacterium]
MTDARRPADAASISLPDIAAAPRPIERRASALPSPAALELLSLQELRARVAELYEAQREVEREREALRVARAALDAEWRSLREQQGLLRDVASPGRDERITPGE